MALASVLCCNAQETTEVEKESKVRHELSLNTYVGEKGGLGIEYSAKWRMSKSFLLGVGTDITYSTHAPVCAYASGKFLIPLRNTKSVIPYINIDLGMSYSLDDSSLGAKVRFDFGVEVPTTKGNLLFGLGPACIHDGDYIYLGIRTGYKF